MSMILLLCESRLRTGKTQVTAKENPRAQRFPVSQGPGRCQRETTSTKFPHFAKPRSLPKKNHEHKIPPFCKAQVAAKKKSLANASLLRDGKPAVHAGQARDEHPGT